MVRLDVNKMQAVQDEALQDTNRDVKKKRGAPKEKKKYDEKNAVRIKQSVRFHRDMIAALHDAAKRERKTYAELVRELVMIGMAHKGISYGS